MTSASLLGFCLSLSLSLLFVLFLSFFAPSFFFTPFHNFFSQPHMRLPKDLKKVARLVSLKQKEKEIFFDHFVICGLIFFVVILIVVIAVYEYARERESSFAVLEKYLLPCL